MHNMRLFFTVAYNKLSDFVSASRDFLALFSRIVIDKEEIFNYNIGALGKETASVCGYFTEKYSRGRRGAPAKGVGRVTVARVQISPSPPMKKDANASFFIGGVFVSARTQHRSTACGRHRFTALL